MTDDSSTMIDYDTPFGWKDLTTEQHMLVFRGHQIPPHCEIGPYRGVPVQNEPRFKLWELFPSVFRSPCLPPATEEEHLAAVMANTKHFYYYTVPCLVVTIFVLAGLYHWLSQCYEDRLEKRKLERSRMIANVQKERVSETYLFLYFFWFFLTRLTMVLNFFLYFYCRRHQRVTKRRIPTKKEDFGKLQSDAKRHNEKDWQNCW